LIFHILTLFPEAFDGYLQSSLVARAAERGLARFDLVNWRSFATDRHHVCDDVPFGGGPGMLLKPEPLFAALESLGASGKRVVFPSPAGKRFDQAYAKRLSSLREVVLVCGRYEGVDQRVVDEFVTDEISIGDYVIFSGEVASMVIVEAVLRLIDGVIRSVSVEEESFSDGLLEYPQYTRPAVYRGRAVPEVLVSGHHAQIEQWRLSKRVEKTIANRPDLLEGRPFSERVRRLLEEMRRQGGPPG
jgi:tRNA (guanine37-N1)-methyltransferase